MKSKFRQKYKDYLIANDIRSEDDLATFIEIQKHTKDLSLEDKQMLFDLVYLLCHEKDSVLSFFFAEKTKNFEFRRSTTTQLAEITPFFLDECIDHTSSISLDQFPKTIKYTSENNLSEFKPSTPNLDALSKNNKVFNYLDEQKDIESFCKYAESLAGVKETEGKLDYELDWEFIEQIASRMAQNKDKYKPYNWKKPLDVEKLKQSLFRHVIEVMKNNYKDDERTFGHLESIALNAMMINFQLKLNKS